MAHTSVTLRAIEVDEEVLIDYGNRYWDARDLDSLQAVRPCLSAFVSLCLCFLTLLGIASKRAREREREKAAARARQREREREEEEEEEEESLFRADAVN